MSICKDYKYSVSLLLCFIPRRPGNLQQNLEDIRNTPTKHFTDEQYMYFSLHFISDHLKYKYVASFSPTLKNQQK